MKKLKSFSLAVAILTAWLTLNNAEPSYTQVTEVAKIEVTKVRKVDNMVRGGKPSRHRLETAPFSPAKSRAYARYILPLAQYKCVDVIWTRESHWNHKADNPRSSAFGIPQMLNLKEKNPYRQIDRGLLYIKQRYGTPCKALAFHNTHGYY